MSDDTDLDMLRKMAARSGAAPGAAATSKADFSGDPDMAWLISHAKAKPAPTDVTFADYAQAAASGVNRGALTGIPGMPVDTALNVWDLLKAGVGTVGGAMGMKPENLPQLTDRASIPMSSDWLAKQVRKTGAGIDPNRPDDFTSRMLAGGGSALISALMLGGPRAAAPPIPKPIPANLQPGAIRAAMASPGAQLGKDAGMAFTSGAAGQGVGDATDSPALGLLAGFSPQIAAKVIPATVRGVVRGGENAGKAMRDRIDVLREAGIDAPSAGLASGNRRATWVDSMLSKLPGSAGVYAASGEGIQRGMQNRVNEIRDNLSPNATPLGAGQAFQDAILAKGGYRDKFNDIYQKKDDIASRYIQQGEANMGLLGFNGFPVPNTLAASNKITAPIVGAENLSALLQTARMPGINTALNADAAPLAPQFIPSIILGPNGQPAGFTQIPGHMGGMPYAAIAGLSTKIGREASNRAIIGTPEQGDFKQLYKALAQDKELAAAASLDMRAVPALQDANAFYASGRKQIDKLSPFVGSAGTPVAPETTFARLESAISKTPSVAESILGSVRGDVRNVQAATIVDRLGRANPGNQNAADDKFSSDTFLTRYSAMHSAGKNAIFTPGIRRDLDIVANAADMVKTGAKVMANPSGSAITGANMATLGTAGSALIGGVVSGHPGSGVLGASAVGAWVTGNYVTAKMLTNPVVVNWLAKATTMTGPRIQQTLGRLAINAGTIKDPETRADTYDFIRGLTEQSPQN